MTVIVVWWCSLWVLHFCKLTWVYKLSCMSTFSLVCCLKARFVYIIMFQSIFCKGQSLGIFLLLSLHFFPSPLNYLDETFPLAWYIWYAFSQGWLQVHVHVLVHVLEYRFWCTCTCTWSLKCYLYLYLDTKYLKNTKYIQVQTSTLYLIKSYIL